MTTIERISKQDLLVHLLSLDKESRYMRFGGFTNDEAVERYVSDIPDTDMILGIRAEIYHYIPAACMHISFDCDSRSAEMGVSVLQEFKRRGYAERLLRYSIDVLRNRGIRQLYSVCLPNNYPLLKLLNKLGITAIYSEDGEKSAHIAIPTAGLDSIMHELQNERLVIIDRTMRPWASLWVKMLSIGE